MDALLLGRYRSLKESLGTFDIMCQSKLSVKLPIHKPRWQYDLVTNGVKNNSDHAKVVVNGNVDLILEYAQ